MTENRDNRNYKNCLWYQAPAKEWIEALPLGNGRIGAMVYGGNSRERIQIDESSFWSGEPSENNNRLGTRALMEEIRHALLAEDYEKADAIGHDFIGNKNLYGTNMPVGELIIQRTGDLPEEYQSHIRELNLVTGVAKTEFFDNGNGFARECFISNPAQVFCMKLENSSADDLEIRYEGIGNDTQLCGFEDGISMAFLKGNALESLHSDGKHGVHLEGCIKIATDGVISYGNHCLCIKGAKYVEVFLDLETTMFVEEPAELAKERVLRAFEKGYETCREEHIQDVKPLFERMDLSLGEEDKNEIPTDVRIRNAAEGKEDLALYALIYQYGRYLLIASSREDSPLPTHMGGIWNDNIYNNIDCTQDMHIDMNLQMQYWAAALCSLPECYQPFFRYMKTVLVPSGTKTAREAYEADGWTAHVVSNPWGFTSLGWAYNWGAWSLGGAWCAIMIWDYYEFTHDKAFLEKEGFSMLEGAVKFVLDYVFYDKKSGYYMAGPSYSPENQFAVDGKNYFLALSNTCDVVLIREVLDVYLKARKALGMDVSAGVETGSEVKNTESKQLQVEFFGKYTLAEKAELVLQKLPPYQIGKRGQIQEWFYDFDEPIPNHRHTSHLLGVYPFQQISQKDEKLAEGVKRSIALRYEDFEITSWGMNMLLGYYARLGEGAGAWNILKDTFRRIVRCNLASVMADGTTMWQGTWELDGNTGLTAAMTELMIQSTEEEIVLLPALLPNWQNGHLVGVSTKNAAKADVFWKDGALEKAVIYPKEDGVYRVKYENCVLEKMLQAGEMWAIGAEDIK